MILYKCDICGKIITEVEGTNPTPSCCGSQMNLLVPGTTDGALEKHVPVYEKKGSVLCVTVGEVEHPMTVEHHVEFIILETNKGFYIRYPFRADSTEHTPKTCFYLAGDEEVISVQEYCNIHGLYVRKS